MAKSCHRGGAYSPRMDSIEADGLAGWGRGAKGRGRKVSIPQAKIDEIVDLTLHYVPEGHTHWSCRVMAEYVGVSPATVQRIWDARGLKPCSQQMAPAPI